MGRKSLKVTRQKEIIKGFYKVAKKEGLENASIAKVAASLEINPSLIIHYFKNRNELILSLIDFILEKYEGIYFINGTKIDTGEKLNMLIDKLFSREWNRLFDDSVFYSCYALTYRDKVIRERFKELHVSLRTILRNALIEAKDNGLTEVSEVNEAAELIFMILEGAYYYTGMADNRIEASRQLGICKKNVLAVLRL